MTQKRSSSSSSKKSSKQQKTSSSNPTNTNRTSSSSPSTRPQSPTSEKNPNNNSGTGNENKVTRLPNTTICLPIVYGSIAFFLGKKADEYHTHRWTLYLRGPNHEDLSAGISKVIFHLHPSFAQPVRELTSPPFEVTEKGWGEFEATIRIVWRDASERSTVLTHGIKLYPPGLPAVMASPPVPPSTKEPVVHEFYDEVVFTDPTESFYDQLQRWSVLPKVATNEESIKGHFLKYNDEEDFRVLISAQKFLDDELKAVKERIMRADKEKAEVERGLKAIAQMKASSSKGGASAGKTAGSLGNSKKGSSKS
eukprot:CAMPEP_0172518062 /NCGR_PEP_ID=MMETSP1066-20121228/290199_1 /TAXON_ID=671091 /ORGANISM="Coscinodiscus wailesii, Strain CCMP2513" /LENGTH=308 /DNA_ID=CAMNT_0013300355 /DNA_START=16 /DNA_END=942 /DNA_ORIENTATION=-